jgi:hypothetical protein
MCSYPSGKETGRMMMLGNSPVCVSNVEKADTGKLAMASHTHTASPFRRLLAVYPSRWPLFCAEEVESGTHTALASGQTRSVCRVRVLVDVRGPPTSSQRPCEATETNRRLWDGLHFPVVQPRPNRRMGGSCCPRISPPLVPSVRIWKKKCCGRGVFLPLKLLQRPYSVPCWKERPTDVLARDWATTGCMQAALRPNKTI